MNGTVNQMLTTMLATIVIKTKSASEKTNFLRAISAERGFP
ncbi:hypothetical protein JMA_43870 (plasmid) [Jeotgalibacillus malaysiensis]|uniref:Uncharacterized protein n=1 Tax=Jeotgalibacillus malaysiensis TaxID=1508404 RepID=A0A0B5B0M3_9BACL|nr:hypothetical protein JMA_43870 [Jeotgalibacillus malaysiensis]